MSTSPQVYEIPLISSPQTLTITLAATQYQLRLTWCDPNQSWIIDIGDANGTDIITGIPLVAGADLLEQFAYLGIGGKLIVQSDFDLSAVPTFTNLGITGHLYFIA